MSEEDHVYVHPWDVAKHEEDGWVTVDDLRGTHLYGHYVIMERREEK